MGNNLKNGQTDRGRNGRLRSTWQDRHVRQTIIIFSLAWLTCTVVIVTFPYEYVVNQRLISDGASIWEVVVNQYIQLGWALLLIGIIYILTHKRHIPDIGKRSPQKTIAKREVLYFLAYGLLIMLGGQLIGLVFDMQGIGLHLHGSFYGSSETIDAHEVLFWAAYNFTFYVIVPAIYVRRKQYTMKSLNLTSLNRKKDAFLSSQY